MRNSATRENKNKTHLHSAVIDLYIKAILKWIVQNTFNKQAIGHQFKWDKTSHMVVRNPWDDDTGDRSQTSWTPSWRTEYKHIYDHSSNESLPHHCNTLHIPHSKEFHDLRGKREEIRCWNYMYSTIQWLSCTYEILTCVDEIRVSQVSLLQRAHFFLLYL